MMFGIGNDLIAIPRIQAALKRHGDRFAERILGPQEMLVFKARGARLAARGVSYLATRFAAKEAFSKAVGLGLRSPMTWRACEVLNAKSGQPRIHLNGALSEWFEAQNLLAHVSVTDETEYAAAMVVVERKTST